ncbi:MAG: NADH-quinone oxidoreductase subunit H [bacterium]|nr:NADH-quinone oxidoreductase subunit H [bacterium]
MTPELLTLLIRIGLIIFVLLTAFAYLTFAERRLLAWFTWRVGPNRVGPWGLLQPLADGVKTVLKQEMIPSHADKFLYFLAPVIALAAAFTMFALIPVGDGVFISNPSIAVLLFLALSSLGAYGVILAGWASQSRYPFIAALRACAQVISYELGLGLALLVPVVIVGSLNIGEIGGVYRMPEWHPLYLVVLLPAGVLFLISALAETARVPFDLPECEAELVAGFMTEYSSMKYAMFPMGEYIAMVAMSAVGVHFFMGGYYLPTVLGIDMTNWLGQLIGNPAAVFGPPHWPWLGDYWQSLSVSALGLSTVATFMGKVAVIVFIFMWIRATLPRLRYDQLMRFGWKFMLPVGLLLVFLASVLVTILPGEADPDGVAILNSQEASHG